MSPQNQKRHSLKGQNGIVRKPAKKLQAYKSLFAMNRGFEIVLVSCAELKKLGFLNAPQLKRFQAMVEELSTERPRLKKSAIAKSMAGY